MTAASVLRFQKRLAAATLVLAACGTTAAMNTAPTDGDGEPASEQAETPSEAGANAKGDYEAMKEGLPGMIVSRRTGDHETVSTDEKILPEDAEIALNWMDLALYGTKQAFETLTAPNVCAKCTPGDWSLKAKHLETLVQ